jgi:hypothetical protein
MQPIEQATNRKVKTGYLARDQKSLDALPVHLFFYKNRDFQVN